MLQNRFYDLIDLLVLFLQRSDLAVFLERDDAPAVMFRGQMTEAETVEKILRVLFPKPGAPGP